VRQPLIRRREPDWRLESLFTGAPESVRHDPGASRSWRLI
jgi:hypothetical protein